MPVERAVGQALPSTPTQPPPGVPRGGAGRYRFLPLVPKGEVRWGILSVSNERIWIGLRLYPKIPSPSSPMRMR